MKPILFNTDMVQAILDGKKTVTRRVVKPQPQHGIEDAKSAFDDIFDIVAATNPPYHPGEILYVRETFDNEPVTPGGHFRPSGVWYYKADGDLRPEAWRGNWRPSIHMPREAARIFLRVTDVRVERLQTPFFEEGCVIRALQKEGIDIGDTCRECLDDYDFPNCNDLDPELDFDEETGEDAGGGSECGNLDGVRYKFSTLWDSTIKPKDREKYGWSANPWVWVISFERIEKPEATP